ncbi:MAG: HAD-IA family hydrolase [Gammaproteobacteria bacterium]|nr:HAD-IA family hydrolase [Gammaproteobacteria bacterium]MCZ6826500.1 HAD-IA family hydrolase [Gammaproteobacteria bacterium]
MNLHDLDAIIFDFDGVLVESVDIKTQAFAALYADHGEKVVAQVEDYHLRHGGVSRFDKFRYFQIEILGRPPLDDREVSDLAGRFSKLVVERVVSAPMVAGAQKFLDHCRDRVPLFIVSGTPTSELDEILERRKLRQYFEGIRGSPGTKAENISELLLEHDINASRCVMIGDATADYEGARSNCVKFLGRVTENNENLFPDEVITFEDFSRLPETWYQT